MNNSLTLKKRKGGTERDRDKKKLLLKFAQNCTKIISLFCIAGKYLVNIFLLVKFKEYLVLIELILTCY